MIYIILFLISFLLTYFIKNSASKFSLVVEPNERSSHTIPTPHGGGIAIAITWFLGIGYLYMNSHIDEKLFYALSIGVVLSVVSFMDDLFELSAKVRLFIQACVSCFGVYLLGGFSQVDLGLFVIENQIVTNLFAFVMIIWFINLYNFLDGIDGYAASEAIFLSIAGFLLFDDSHFLVLIVSVLGFLVWNWPRAKIFMGDVGSTLLGYNVAIFTLYYANEQNSNLWVWIILFGLFWFDATITLFRRWKNREKLSQAHKKHAYQRLTQIGWSHSKVVVYAMIINIVLFCLVYYAPNIVVVFFMAIAMLYVIVKFVDKKNRF